uniref:Globin family profile domain-containing protein n=1 Tax=Globodera rostochiensis TaxID=31243 RepID=A0A914GX79_GLORO
MPIEGQTSSTSACKNGIFRRAQSLRFPRSSATQQHHGTFTPGTSSTPSTSLNRHGSRAYRSKSSRQRYGSIEVQSLLSRMSSGQRLALCSTWRQMRHQLTTLMRKILVELEQHEPEVKDIFYKAQYVDCFASSSSTGNLATMDEHVRLMAKFFDELIAFVEMAGPSGTEGGEEITSMIKGVGQQHAILAHSSGLSAEVWEKLGEIAMEKFCAVEAVQKTREAGRAWRTLIAFLTDKIRCGFEGEAKAFCRRPSNEQQQQNATENGTAAETDDGGAMGGRFEMLGRRLQQLRTTDCDWTPAEGPNRHGGTTASANGRIRHE